MTFMELALRGVRNFTEFSRIPLRTGLNLIYGGNQSGKSTILQVLRQVLRAEGASPMAADADQWDRVALTFRGGTGRTYCLARHFSDQQEKLGWYDRSGHVTPLDTPDEGADPYQPGQRPEGSLWSLCLEDGASNALTHAGAGAESHLATAFDDANSDRGARDDEDHDGTNTPGAGHDGGALMVASGADRRLTELAEAEAAAAEAEHLANELSACYDERTLLQKRHRELSERADMRRAILDEIATLGPVDDLPEGIVDAVVAHEEDAHSLRDQRIALDQDIVNREDVLDALPKGSPMSRPGPYVGGVMALSAGLAYPTLGAHPLVLGTIGVGMIALLGPIARGLRLSGQRKAIRREIAHLHGAQRDLQAGLAERHESLLSSLAELGYATPRKAYGALERHLELSAQLAEIDTEQKANGGAKALTKASAALDALSARIESIQEAYAALGMAGADVASVRRERNFLTRAVQSGHRGAVPDVIELDMAIESRTDLSPGDLDLLQRQREPFVERAIDLMGSFTGGEFSGLTGVSELPSEVLLDDDEGVGAPRCQVPGTGVADMILLAQHIALVETLDPEGHYPLVLDEPFGSLDAVNRSRVYDTLRECADRRQIIVLTCHQFVTDPADHVVRLST